jgi:dolichol-phosphate mannosyltransferase
VIPIYNEEENLEELHRQLLQVLEGMAVSWEVILVNDGSRDRSMTILEAMHSRDPRFRVIEFARNFGHQAALYAGLQASSGNAVVLMDGDLQDPPSVIPALWAEWQQGNEVVFAVRRKRKEGFLKRFLYAAFYRLLRSVSRVPIPVDSGDFSLMDRKVVDVLARLPERNKFLRGLRAWAGFRQVAVEYERDARFAGTPKYTTAKLIRLALDGLVSYSVIPLRLAFLLGFAMAAVSLGLASFYFFQRLFTDQSIPQGFTTLAILILFLGSVQLISIGILGEYLGRIYDETKRRPEYVVSRTYGLPGASDRQADE